MSGSGGKPPSLMRSLGQFWGHVVRAVKSPADERSERERREVRRDVEEQSHDAEGGRVTVRRTTIEEVEFERDEPNDSGG